MRRGPLAVSAGIVLFTLTLLFAIVAAQDIKGPVSKGTSPDQWEKQFDEGKYDVKDAVSGPMFQILAKLPDAIKDASGSDCRRAAAARVWEVVSDAANGAPLAGLMSAIQSAMGNILSLGEKGVVDFIKENTQDFIKQTIKDKLKGQKPEMYKTSVTKAGCKVKLIAIWDKAAGTYDVYVYGDCDCTAQAFDPNRPATKLKTFAAHFHGNARIQFDSGSQAIVVNVGNPKVTLEALCAPCRTPNSSTTTVPPTQTTTSIPSTQPTPGGQTTPPPAGQPCAVAKPCPECMPIYDAIQTACKRLDEIPGEQRDLAGRRGGAANRLAGATGQEARDIQKEIDGIDKESRKLAEEEQGLKKKSTDLAAQLKDCQATKCGTGTLVEPKTAGIPKYVYPVAAAVPVVLIAGGGGDKSTSTTMTSIPVAATTSVTTSVTTSTASTSSAATTSASSTTTTAPQTVTGVWNVTSCRTTDDQANHELFIALCRALVQLGLTEGNLTLTITGTPPFVTITGEFTATSGTFSGTGRGTVAGNANVGVSGQGTFTITNGQGRLMYTMGTGGELPTGRSVTYEILVTKQSSF